jgi:hypothetical protein
VFCVAFSEERSCQHLSNDIVLRRKKAACAPLPTWSARGGLSTRSYPRCGSLSAEITACSGILGTSCSGTVLPGAGRSKVDVPWTAFCQAPCAGRFLGNSDGDDRGAYLRTRCRRLRGGGRGGSSGIDGCGREDSSGPEGPIGVAGTRNIGRSAGIPSSNAAYGSCTLGPIGGKPTGCLTPFPPNTGLPCQGMRCCE